MSNSSTSAALRELLARIPAPNAPLSERVQWMFDKADVLRAIAAEGGPNAVEAAQLAREADAKAFEMAKEALR